MTFFEIPVEQLRWQCDVDHLELHATHSISPPDPVLGQERAYKAFRLGAEMIHAGYNIFVCGTTGLDPLALVQQMLPSTHRSRPTPPELCYVFGFKNPDQPRLLSLQPGQGRALKKAMEDLAANLKRDIPRVFASQRFQHRLRVHEQQAKRRQQRLVEQFEASMQPHFGFLDSDADLMTPSEIVPIVDNQLIALDSLEERVEKGLFSPQQYRYICEQHQAFCDAYTDVYADVQRLQHEAQESASGLQRALLRPIIQQAVAEVKARFDDVQTQQYLQDVEAALYEDIERFREPVPNEQETPHPPPPPMPVYEEDIFHEYQVNIIVEHDEADGAPLVLETSPTFKNLFGVIEPMFEYGGIVRNDFTGIRAGAIHRANGGYLVFDARDAFADPLVWVTLKRILRYGQADIQAYDQHALAPSTALKPEPIPCQVKIIMIGDEALYEALVVEDELSLQAKTITQYAGFIQRVCQEEALRAFDSEAVAAVIEFAVRLAGRQNKLSADLDKIVDVLREANYWAGECGLSTVSRDAVQQAIREGSRRVNLIEDKMQEMVGEGLLLIDTRGAVVGQVNGLSIYQLEDDYQFGFPMRITAETSVGDAGVVNIEREVDLGDSTHNKGVLILNGYLRRTYAQDKPLVLSASLCVEQSYEGIVGDSASAAEVYALLSSLSDLPIDQGIAVTGSVNQKGQLQPVSGINEKVEGFFDVCRLQGLSNSQGVIMPPQNIDDLMLRDDVVTAVREGRFHLYAAPHIDDGLAILTGFAAGAYCPEGGYPDNTVNGRVDTKLRHFAEQWHALRHGASSR
jgi:predicted ATP-dependent protease